MSPAIPSNNTPTTVPAAPAVPATPAAAPATTPATTPVTTPAPTSAPAQPVSPAQPWQPTVSPSVAGVNAAFDQAWANLMGGATPPSAEPVPAAPPADPTQAATPGAIQVAPVEPAPSTPTEADELQRLIDAEFGAAGETTPVQTQPAQPAETAPTQPATVTTPESEGDLDLSKQHPEVQKYLSTKLAQKMYANHRLAAETTKALEPLGVPLDPVVLREHVMDARIHGDLLRMFAGEQGDEGRQKFTDYFFGNDPRTGKPYQGSAEVMRQVVDMAMEREDLGAYAQARSLGEVRDSLAVIHNNPDTPAEKRQQIAAAVGVLDNVLNMLGAPGSPAHAKPTRQQTAQPTQPAQPTHLAQPAHQDEKEARIAQLEAELARVTGRAPEQIQRDTQMKVMGAAVGQHIRRVGDQFDKIVGKPEQPDSIYASVRTAFLTDVRNECMRDQAFRADVEVVQKHGAELQPSEVAVISHRVNTKMQEAAAKQLRNNAARYRNVVHGNNGSNGNGNGNGNGTGHRPATPIALVPPQPAQPGVSPTTPTPLLTQPPIPGNVGASGAPLVTSGQSPQGAVGNTTMSNAGLANLTPGQRASQIALSALDEKLKARGVAG